MAALEKQGTEATFSVELLGFPATEDPDELSESLASFFGIGTEDAQRIVQQAPIRVKRGASRDVATQLVQNLLDLGADVRLRHDASGQERVYRAANFPRGTDHDLEPIPDGSGMDTLPSAEIDEPFSGEQIPASPVESSREREAESPKRKRPISLSIPGGAVDSVRAPSSPRVVETPPARISERTSGASLPPPSSSQRTETCGSCSRAVNKDEVCTKCGWDNTEKKRFCRQCKGKLKLTSTVARRASLLGGLFFIAAAAGAAAFLFFGLYAAVIVPALYAAFVFWVARSSTYYLCPKCNIEIRREKLMPSEAKAQSAARMKPLLAAAVCAAIAVVGLVLFFFSRPVLIEGSFNNKFTLRLPRTHTEMSTTVTQVKVPSGKRMARIQSAVQPHFGGTAYHLARVQYFDFAADTPKDPAGLAEMAKQLITAGFSGTLDAPCSPADGAVRCSFKGTFHDKPVSGQIRGSQADYDMVFVIVTSSADLPADAFDGFLASLITQQSSGN